MIGELHCSSKVEQPYNKVSSVNYTLGKWFYILRLALQNLKSPASMASVINGLQLKVQTKPNKYKLNLDSNEAI